MGQGADLKAVKERIRREKRKGDATLACRRAGVSDVIFRTAMAKNSFDALTPSEERVLSGVVRILDGRVKNRKKLTSPC